MDAGRRLDKAKMVRFDERTGYFSSTDLGRIASHFYIKYDTVEVALIHSLDLIRLRVIKCHYFYTSNLIIPFTKLRRKKVERGYKREWTMKTQHLLQ